MEPELVVYGDFNCPFCYALSEQLFESALNESVEWRPVEHLPDASCDTFTPIEQSRLTTDVYNVRHRVPSLEIAVPPCRPNTALCNQVFLSISQLLPAKADAFRQAVFHALWVDGLDISASDVLDGLLRKLGIDEAVNCQPSPRVAEQLSRWQLDWTADRFEGRIPAMVVDDRLLLGLESLSDIERFQKGEVVLDDRGTLAHDLQPLQSIAVIG